MDNETTYRKRNVQWAWSNPKQFVSFKKCDQNTETNFGSGKVTLG